MVNRKKERQEVGRGNKNRGRGRKTNNIGIGQGRNDKGNEPFFLIKEEAIELEEDFV